MKTKGKSAGGKPTAEKPQGRGRGTGVNKAVEKVSVPQRVARNTVGVPTQRQKL